MEFKIFVPLKTIFWILLLIFSFNGGADTSVLCQIVFKSVKRHLSAKIKVPIRGFLVTSAAKHPALRPFVDKMIEEKTADVRHIKPDIDFEQWLFADTRRALSFLLAYRTSYGFKVAERVIRRDFADVLRQENTHPGFASESLGD